MLRPGQVFLSIGDCIPVATDNMLAESKKARALFNAELCAMKQAHYSVKYFASMVFDNYTYKGAEVEHYVSRTLKNKKFSEWMGQLPQHGVVALTHVEWGAVSLMAALIYPQVEFYATDDDAQKLLLASRCGSIPKNLHYVATNQLPVEADRVINVQQLLES